MQPGRSRIVVIGASLAGLFAAAAAEQATSVVVVERDRFPVTPTPRAGVPQGQHQHVLLHRGLIAAEQLLPGLREDLVHAGAVSIDTGDLLWLGPSGWSVSGEREFEVLAATRPLLEHVVRTRVAALPHVELRDDTEVHGLCVDAGRVTGVELRNGGREHADLVVDAGGRNSHLPAWLRAAGLPRPDEQVVDARIGYASRLYRADRSWFAGAGLFILATPQSPTGASVLSVEDGRWLVTVVGIGEHRPPRDEPGFHTFLTGLRDPAVADFASRAAPAGPISWHRRTANHRRRYERIRPWPRGLLVVGDALCAFNPIYGHGITVAALQALELRAALTSAPPGDIGRRLLRRIARRAALRGPSPPAKTSATPRATADPASSRPNSGATPTLWTTSPPTATPAPAIPRPPSTTSWPHPHACCTRACSPPQQEPPYSATPPPSNDPRHSPHRLGPRARSTTANPKAVQLDDLDGLDACSTRAAGCGLKP